MICPECNEDRDFGWIVEIPASITGPREGGCWECQTCGWQGIPEDCNEGEPDWDLLGKEEKYGIR